MNTDEMLSINLEEGKGNLIKVIGVGGAGSNAVKYMNFKGIKDVSFAICNTDLQALEKSKIPERIQIGATLTEGRGAGNKPLIGQQAAEENIKDIERLIEDSNRMVFITAGMGGGTGTGAAPVVARVCKEKGMLTIGIVTVPFCSEGKKRKKQAHEGITEIQKYVDSLIIINSERIRDIHGDLSLSQAFAKADDLLSTAAKSIAEIITVHGHVNVDFADVYSVMHESGVANMGSAIGIGKNRALDAVKDAITSPLLNNSNIYGAKDVLVNITSASGEYEATMNEIDIIQTYIQDRTGDSANIIWGSNIDDSLEDKLQVTVIVTGFGANALSDDREVISIERDMRNIEKNAFKSNESFRNVAQSKIDFEINHSKEDDF